MLGEEHFEVNEIALGDWENRISEEYQTTLENIRLVRSCVEEGEKDTLAAVKEFICNENPILWLQQTGREFAIIKGCHFDRFEEFCHLMTLEKQGKCSQIQAIINRYKAPEVEPFPKKRKRGGKRAGNFFYTYYGELESGSKTEEVFKILERRHLWLDQGAKEQADELTEEFKDHELTKFEIAIYYNLAVGPLTPEKREKYKKYLSRNSILEKLQRYQSDRSYPLYNCFYSQTSGRIEPQWLHPQHISEKIGQSDQYPGGVRQAIFCAKEDGGKLSASDCCASAWQLASLFLSDEKTKEIACGENKNFNTEMTKKALSKKGIDDDYFYFDENKLTEKGRDEKGKERVARELVKKLLMTTLYGSTPEKHLEWANSNDYGGIWKKPENSKEKSGAARFISDCKKEFRVLMDYVLLMKKVAQVACEKYPKGFKMPYIFEENAWLHFDYPKMASKQLSCPRSILSRKKQGTTKDYDIYLKLPKTPFQLDKKQIKLSLPPLLIHSIDSTVIKHLIILLDKKIPEGHGFATIHDCVFFPKDVITPDCIQELWNEALKLTYQSFEPLYKWIIEEILKPNPEKAGKYLNIAEEAYKEWKIKVDNPDYLNKLWMSTDLEY
jgi:hypothetical protein